jgi:hypothetical protein
MNLGEEEETAFFKLLLDKTTVYHSLFSDSPITP